MSMSFKTLRQQTASKKPAKIAPSASLAGGKFVGKLKA
jgi:hypothetical protein